MGDDFVMHSHDASFSVGNKGIFFCTPNLYKRLQEEKIQGYVPLYETGGYIRYTKNDVGVKAVDNKKSYKELSEIHDSILVVSRQPMVEWKDGERFFVDLCDPQSETTIEVSLDNIAFTSEQQDKFVEFDVLCKATPNGILFGKAEFQLSFPTDVFGQSIVQNGFFQVQKEQVILANSYSLTAQDVSSNSLKILINPSGIGTNFYPMTVADEKLCHVKMKIANPLAIFTLHPNSFNFSGNAWYYCGRDYYLFRNIKFDDFIKPITSNPEKSTNITYTFENLHILNNGNNLKIDIYASCSSPTSFAGVQVEFSFNTASLAFDNSITGFGLLRGEIVQDVSIYSIEIKNSVQPNIVRFRYESLEALGNFLLDNTPRKLASVTLRIVNCNEPINLEFLENNMQGESNHYTGNDPIPWEAYDPVIANDTETTTVCGCNTAPQIVGLNPTTIRAGVRDVLTITGNNFGVYNPTQCKVIFPDGDDGGFSDAVAEIGDIINWSDTEIKVYVPSTTNGSGFKNPACSGKVKLRNGCGTSPSSADVLHIRYAVFNNRGSVTQPASNLTLADFGGNGYLFHYANNVDGWMKNAFQEALGKWCEETEINFNISTNTPVDGNGNAILIASANDGFNTITVENIAGDGQAAVVYGTAYFKICLNQSTGKGSYIMNEIDIKIDVGINNYQRLVDGLVHELGHAQMLQHSKHPDFENGNNQYVMFFNLFNVDDWEIKDDDEEGAEYVYSSSSQALTGSGCNGDPIQTGVCGSVINLSDELHIGNNLSVYPNPVDNILRVEIHPLCNSDIKWTITDVVGNNLLSGVGNYNDCNFEISTSTLQKGMYTLLIHTQKGIYSTKIIKHDVE